MVVKGLICRIASRIMYLNPHQEPILESLSTALHGRMAQGAGHCWRAVRRKNGWHPLIHGNKATI